MCSLLADLDSTGSIIIRCVTRHSGSIELVQPGVQAGQTGFVIKAEEVKIKMHTPQLLHEAELNHSLPDRRGEMADRQTDTVSARPPPHLIIKSREQRWTFLVQCSARSGHGWLGLTWALTQFE